MLTYASIRQHTAANAVTAAPPILLYGCVCILLLHMCPHLFPPANYCAFSRCGRMWMLASIRLQHADTSIRMLRILAYPHAAACGYLAGSVMPAADNIRQHTSAYVSIRQHTMSDARCCQHTRGMSTYADVCGRIRQEVKVAAAARADMSR